MTQEEIKKFQDRLVAEKEKLETQLSSFASRDGKESFNFDARKQILGDSPEDDALEEEVFMRNVAVEHALEQRLKEILEALSKINKNEFGICERCRKVIEEKKLEVNPASDFCISCSKIVSQQRNNQENNI
jgi:DnaK suppressor protein